MTNWILFIGRFHPVLVHLPIGMLVLLAILEIAGIRRTYRESIAKVRMLIVPILAVCAVITATCGWLLATGGDYNPQLLFWHRWLGVSVAGLCVIMLVETRLKWLKSYFLTLAVTLAVVAVTGHLGGSMTYGSDYLTQYAPGPIKQLLGVSTQAVPVALPKISHISNALVYPQIVQAILTQNCVTCHGPHRQKGGLRLDSYQRLMHGRHGKPVVLLDHPARSILIKRIELPVGKSHRMPPSGHRPLTAGEIAILRWWVQAGVPNRVSLLKAAPPASIMADIRKLFSHAQSQKPIPRKEVEAMVPLLTQRSGMRIRFLGPKSNMLSCSARKNPVLSDQELSVLNPVILNIANLNLDSTSITDGAMRVINEMVNLKSLHLRHTRVDGKGLFMLNRLSSLRYLSVPSNKITAADIAMFKKRNFIPNLVVAGDGGISALPDF
ncbi:MAG: c-type cytochrome domain-containing protein [Phycisphaerae bacterium]